MPDVTEHGGDAIDVWESTSLSQGLRIHSRDPVLFGTAKHSDGYSHGERYKGKYSVNVLPKPEMNLP
jgi:hypothetical protein